MNRITGATKQAEGFRVEGLAGLSKAAENFLHGHPREARLAVAVALETAAAQHGAYPRKAFVKVPDRLQPFIVHRSTGADKLGVSATAKRLGISRTTVYAWVENKTLLAWRSTKRGLTIPAAQIVGPGKVVPGLARILRVIEDPELAWEFLTQEWPFSDRVALPLEELKAGRIEDVVNAAPGFGADFT